MWVGFQKGAPRTEDGKFATTATDSGIGHRGDGTINLRDVLQCPAGTMFDGVYKSGFASPKVPTKPKGPTQPVAQGAPSFGGSQDGPKTPAGSSSAKPVSNPDLDDDDQRLANLPAEGDNSVAWWTLGAMNEVATSGAVGTDAAAPEDPFAKKMRQAAAKDYSTGWSP
jgi:hypothetical protein